jgi:broad specificity phosphatase PhoE
MGLGIWDGELIEDIKAKFPEEYARRGDDIRNYRVPGGENFYDLRSRVLREFHRIFAEDFRAGSMTGVGGAFGDLIIVAHLGVISALAEELQPETYGDGKTNYFNTGSVTMIEAPEWLWPERGPA